MKASCLCPRGSKWVKKYYMNCFIFEKILLGDMTSSSSTLLKTFARWNSFKKFLRLHILLFYELLHRASLYYRMIFLTNVFLIFLKTI